MFSLRKIDGPECQCCGCRDSRLLRRTQWFNRPCERRRCNHCGSEWNAILEPEAEPEQNLHSVVFPTLRCPKCRSKQVKVQGKKPHGVRQHKCDDCGWTFKSVETDN